MGNDLQRIDLTEFLLSHEDLAQCVVRGDGLPTDNATFFKFDYKTGILDRYKGTAVAYHKGILCGQSSDIELLLHEASTYFGGSSLTVFPVPASLADLEKAVLAARVAK